MIKFIQHLLSISILLISLTGCSVKEEKHHDSIVSIPMTLIVDTASDQKENEKLINQFNESQDKYHIEVTWTFETIAVYRNNLKNLNVIDKLPAILTDIYFSPNFYRLMIHNDRLVDLAPFLDKDEEWKHTFGKETLEVITEPDGSIYGLPNGSNLFSNTGIFWNKELFASVGITQFPETWDEFFEVCAVLSSHGIIPLGLHTAGTAWSPMLLATAKLGTSEEGRAFLSQSEPETFDLPVVRELLETIQKLYQYGTFDSLGHDFDYAYQQFMKEEVAMLPNGFWMIDQIPTTLRRKISFNLFPEKITVTSSEMSGWGISSIFEPDVIEGAVAFLKYRSMDNYYLTQRVLNNQLPVDELNQTYYQAIKEAPSIVENYQVHWRSESQTTLEQNLPEFITGNVSVDEFIGLLDQTIIRK